MLPKQDFPFIDAYYMTSAKLIPQTSLKEFVVLKINLHPLQVFADMFDKIIDDRHGGYKPGQKHTTDLDHTKVKKQIYSDRIWFLNCHIRQLPFSGKMIRLCAG